jgi:hypothetical protein
VIEQCLVYDSVLRWYCVKFVERSNGPPFSFRERYTDERVYFNVGFPGLLSNHCYVMQLEHDGTEEGIQYGGRLFIVHRCYDVTQGGWIK